MFCVHIVAETDCNAQEKKFYYVLIAAEIHLIKMNSYHSFYQQALIWLPNITQPAVRNEQYVLQSHTNMPTAYDTRSKQSTTLQQT